MKVFHIGIAILMLLGLFAVQQANAQVDYATATLKGTVLDPQGAVVSGATVTVTNMNTGISRTTKTGADGTFQVSALPPGTYKVQTEAPGFAKTIANNLQLSVGQVVISEFRVKVGAVSETVEVEAAPPLIEVERTQQSNNINESQVHDLPNITRNITQAVYTLPGVSNADAPRSQTPGFTGFFTTGFSIGGSNGRNNLSTIDGGENEYGTGQYRVSTIPIDSIQEFQVNRNSFNAEFGFSNGSAINIVTRSGGNVLHGSVSGFFNDHSTSAKNFFNGVLGLPDAYSQNFYGSGTLGGPVKKDKLFFNLTYEYRNLNSPDYTNAGILSAPTVLGIGAPGLGNNCAAQFTSKAPDQLCYINALKSSGNPFLVGFANGITPGLTPLNNAALNTILTKENGIFTDPGRFHNAILRLDASPNASNSVGVRLGYAHNNYAVGSPGGSSLFTRDFSVLGNWSHTFSPSVVNQLKFPAVTPLDIKLSMRSRANFQARSS